MRQVWDIIRKGRAALARDPSEPKNELERLFLKAMREASARDAFYEAFLHSKLFLGGRLRAPGEAELQYYELGAEKILPVFSSAERLDKVLGASVPRMSFTGLEIIRDVAPGIVLALNPYSDCGREFALDELKELLERES